MLKRVSILLLLFFAFASAPVRAGHSSTSTGNLLATKKHAINLTASSSSIEFNLTQSQNITARTSTPVQKDSSSGTGGLYDRESEFHYLIDPLSITGFPFFKNYIDHIYPSHHFW